MPFDTGSTSDSVIAVARIASTAVPPSASICRPACAASGCVVETVLAARTGLRGQAYGFCHEKSVAAALMSMSGSFHVEDDAAENFTRLQPFQGGIRVARRPCFDRRRLDLLLPGERNDFAQFLQVAHIGADDADGALRNRRQRMGDLAAEQAADDIAAAFAERRDARDGGGRTTYEIDRRANAGARLRAGGRALVAVPVGPPLGPAGELGIVDTVADARLHAASLEDRDAEDPGPAA